MPPSDQLRVVLEVGKKRVFAFALDWPGWSRSGRTEGNALIALMEYATRYAALARRARISFAPVSIESITVIERVAGDATTDFGAPNAKCAHDATPTSTSEAKRLASLVAASWHSLDDSVADAPPQLRKGPRGGGRDRDAIVEHCLAAEVAYARKIGVRHRSPGIDDHDAIESLRGDILAVLRTPSDGSLMSRGEDARGTSPGWPTRYAARRIAWHVLDHAWEITDRSDH